MCKETLGALAHQFFKLAVIYKSSRYSTKNEAIFCDFLSEGVIHPSCCMASVMTKLQVMG